MEKGDKPKKNRPRGSVTAGYSLRCATLSLGISRRFFRLAAYEQARRALRRECVPVSSALRLGKPVQSETATSRTKKRSSFEERRSGGDGRI